MLLYNKLSAAENAIKIDAAAVDRLTLSFYAYTYLDNPQQFRDTLFRTWSQQDVLGRIHIAHEGINAQLSLPSNRLSEFRSFLDTFPFLKGIRLNIALAHDNKSFLKLKIKVRDKIVADGLNDTSFDVTQIGTHLKAAEFNEMIDHTDVLLVDMRNRYESEVGHFKNAITPDVETFRASLPIIDEQLEAHKTTKKIVLYCTGGIRCEKASAYFKHRGYEQVYQLEGGIIEYTNQVKAQGLENRFVGKNFVFDNRLGERVSDDIIAHCHICGTSCDTHTNCANDSCHRLFIQCDDCKRKMHNCCCETCCNLMAH